MTAEEEATLAERRRRESDRQEIAAIAEWVTSRAEREEPKAVERWLSGAIAEVEHVGTGPRCEVSEDGCRCVLALDHGGLCLTWDSSDRKRAIRVLSGALAATTKPGYSLPLWAWWLALFSAGGAAMAVWLVS